ncbi:MAG: patatin-like phospholipase family protein, partial [Bacteroidales bacterium]
GYEEEIDVNTGGFLNLFALAHLETLDNSYYPKRGYSLKGSYMMINQLRDYTEFDPLHAMTFSFRWAHSLGRRVILESSMYGRLLLEGKLSYPYLNVFGGDHLGRYAAQQVPFIGVQRPEVADILLGVVRLDLRVELWKNHYLSAIGNYGYNGEDFFDGLHMYGVGLKYAYNTMLGPVSLLIDYSNRTSKVGAYISLGRFF